ncbi:MAG: EamA family transporter [Pseudomonadales bacterium]|nr:EamA family transporter [Pseudomonadales bacterium]
MSVPVNYLAVIFIWSTTPLAIHFSNQSLSAHAAILLRMLLAFLLAAIFIAVWRNQSTLKRQNWKVYLVAALAIFPNMPLVYMAAKTIPSGLISVLFALTPLTTGLLAAIFLKQRLSSVYQVSAIFIALAGVLVIFQAQISLQSEALPGILMMLLSNLIFSASQVGTKYLQACREEKGEPPVDVFEQTFGALTFAVPGLFISWCLFDGQFPTQVSTQSLWSIVYLAVIGSLIGFAAYFAVLKNYSVAIVSLIPLITPALALWLGATILSEPVSRSLQLGTALIIAGLFIYDTSLLKSVWDYGKRQMLVKS